ncbi:MAG: DUF4326 domain-containing protein [Opitutaceae bacterium]|nr:DUF4326 domain-containing protein [Opitutaceae bacterium]
MPKILNKHHFPSGVPEGAVYIGRPSKWGNPFAIGKDGDRETVIAKFREWIAGQPGLIEAARRELAGRDLVCFCAPRPCHGDVLLEIANPGHAAPDRQCVPPSGRNLEIDFDAG